MPSGKKIDVLGLGSITIDYIGTIDKWPDEGEKYPIKQFSICGGGLIGTALVAAARLGGKVCFAGKLGSSEMSKRALKSLQAEGINTSFVIKEKNAEPILSFVLTNTITGMRNIFWTNQSVKYPSPSEFPYKNWFKKIRVLLVDHICEKAGIEAAKIARQNGIPVIIDVEQNMPWVPALIENSSHISPI